MSKYGQPTAKSNVSTIWKVSRIPEDSAVSEKSRAIQAICSATAKVYIQGEKHWPAIKNKINQDSSFKKPK